MRFIYYLQLTYVVRLLTLMTIHTPTHTTAVFVPYMLHRIYLSTFCVQPCTTNAGTKSWTANAWSSVWSWKAKDEVRRWLTKNPTGLILPFQDCSYVVTWENLSALRVLLLVDLRKSCRWQNVSMCRPTQVGRFKNVCFPFVGLRWRHVAGQIPAFTLTVTQWSPCELGLSHCAPNFKMHSRDTRRFGSHRSSAVWDVIPLYQQSQRSFVNTP